MILFCITSWYEIWFCITSCSEILFCLTWRYEILYCVTLYSYWLGSRTTAVLFDPRTDPFEGQTKLLLSEEPVYNCFVIHLHFFLNIHFFHSHISIRCFKYPRPSSPRIGTTFWHCDVNITWLREPMKIRPSVNSSIAGNRSMNCWPVNRTVLQLLGILLFTAKMLCIYCICFIFE